jgi:hypothetical protein
MTLAIVFAESASLTSSRAARGLSARICTISILFFFLPIIKFLTPMVKLQQDTNAQALRLLFGSEDEDNVLPV